MIGQALQIMLFGMLGIFVVMGLIILVISLLNRFAGDKQP
ncbi:OadG family protein [Clostridia bacterium OttesenSCG-928-O13]|nr:OadG family protein [Clostridia bacterium OttesenSCG-928-O13]